MTSTAYEGQKKKPRRQVRQTSKMQGGIKEETVRMESVINMQIKTTKPIKITTIDINRTVF